MRLDLTVQVACSGPQPLPARQQLRRWVSATLRAAAPARNRAALTVRIVDEACHEMPANKMGSIVVKLPLPPGSLPYTTIANWIARGCPSS